jgi:hypothetical protein
MYLRRMLLRFGILTLTASQPLFVPLFAQSDACPPTDLAQTDLSAAQNDAGLKEITDAVEFHGDNPLSDAQQSKLIKQIQELSGSWTSVATNGDWVEFAAQDVRGELQAAGYFKAIVNAKPFLIRADKLELHFVLRIELESGIQYRLGNVRIENVDPDVPLNFSATLLRQQFDVKSGDLFDVSRIRQFLERLTGLYGSKGYIDMVATPETQPRDPDSRIDLSIKIDEGSPYRIARIEVLGASAQEAQDLQPPQAAGEILDRALWPKFFESHKSQLRGANPDQILQIARRPRNHTVNLTLDFRSCAEPSALPILHSHDIDLESLVPVAGTAGNRTLPLKSKVESPASDTGATNP